MKDNIKKDIEIKLKIINEKEDINSIIENKELDLSKWNVDNITNLSWLFSSCESLSFTRYI